MWYRIFKIVSNKYFIATAFFVVWLSFFDNNSLLIQNRYSSQLKGMQKEMEFYQQEIKSNKETIKRLNGDLESLEKFAREKYLMKKDEEDVFVVIKEDD